MIRVRPLLNGIIWGLLLGLLWAPAGAALPQGNSSSDSLYLEPQLRRESLPDRVVESWWTRDKRLHLVVSAGMVGIGFHLLHDRWLRGTEDSRRLAVSLTALGGVVKELTDKRKRSSTFSYKDLAADGLGILVGIFLFAR